MIRTPDQRTDTKTRTRLYKHMNILSHNSLESREGSHGFQGERSDDRSPPTGLKEETIDN